MPGTGRLRPRLSRRSLRADEGLLCCGKGAACTGPGLTDRQVRDASRVLAEVFGSPRARYEASDFATRVRESREAAAYWREVFDCGADVLGRGGSADEFMACEIGG